MLRKIAYNQAYNMSCSSTPASYDRQLIILAMQEVASEVEKQKACLASYRLALSKTASVLQMMQHTSASTAKTFAGMECKLKLIRSESKSV